MPLAELVDHVDLRMADVEHIGRQILREHPLRVFPRLKAKLWRDKRRKWRCREQEMPEQSLWQIRRRVRSCQPTRCLLR